MRPRSAQPSRASPACLRPGQHMPAFCVRAAFPADPSCATYLRACLEDAGSGRVVTAWCPPGSAAAAAAAARAACARDAGRRGASADAEWAGGAAGPPLVFQQEEAAAPEGCSGGCACGSPRGGSGAAVQHLWLAPPGAGRWRARLQVVRERRGFMSFRVAGLGAPMEVTLYESEDVARFDLVMPPPARHDESSGGPLASAATPPAPLPVAARAAGPLGAQLVEPVPGVPLVADMPQRFVVAVGGGGGPLGGGGTEAVWVGAAGHGWTQLEERAAAPAGAAAGGGGGRRCQVFGGSMVLPRCAVLTVAARRAGGGGCAARNGGTGGAAGQLAALPDGAEEVFQLTVQPPVRLLPATG